MGRRLTEAERALREIPEKTLQADIMELARMTGWRLVHFHDSRRMVTRGGKSFMIGDKDAKGFPDLLLLRPPSILVIEVKRELGKVEPEQEAWLQAWRDCGVDVIVARPSNWEEVQRKLTARRSLS